MGLGLKLHVALSTHMASFFESYDFATIVLRLSTYFSLSPSFCFDIVEIREIVVCDFL